MSRSRPPLALVGPTGSGKTSLALELARLDHRFELVSMDSMSVYRGMDIGTAKPTESERRGTPVFGLDLVDPDEEFSAAQFLEVARAAASDIENRGSRVLFVGGTGLYHRSVVDQLDIPGRWPEIAADLERAAGDPGGLDDLYRLLCEQDPVAAGRIGRGNRRRIVRALEVSVGSGRPFSSFGPGLSEYPASRVNTVGIPFRPEIHDPLIESRFRSMVDNGLLDEVRMLSERPAPMSRTARQALGYKELLAHIEGEVSLDEAISVAIQRTKRLARRQWSWFKRDPRISWLDLDGGLMDQLVGLAVAGAPY